MSDDKHLGTWKVMVGWCNTLESFNRFIIPLMRSETPECKEYAATIAKRRGWRANKEKGCYE